MAISNVQRDFLEAVNQLALPESDPIEVYNKLNQSGVPQVSRVLAQVLQEKAKDLTHSAPLLQKGIDLLLDRFPFEEGWLKYLLPYKQTQTQTDRIYTVLSSRIKGIWERVNQMRELFSEEFTYPQVLGISLFYEKRNLPSSPTRVFSFTEFGLPRDLLWDSTAKTVSFVTVPKLLGGAHKEVFEGACLDRNPKTAPITQAIAFNCDAEEVKFYKMFVKSNIEGIWPVTQIFEYGDQFVITMPLAEGSLWDLLQTSLTFEEKVSILKQITNGLRFIHESGYIHRDIKTDNVLYKRVDGEIVVGLIDFGLSEEISAHCFSMHGYYGTVYCTPPELFGDPNFAQDPTKAEMWALGFLFFEICFGESPEWSPITDSYQHIYDTTPISSEDVVEIKRLHDETIIAERDKFVHGAIESKTDLLHLHLYDLLAWNQVDRPTIQEVADILSLL